jgi:hypothetical protein
VILFVLACDRAATGESGGEPVYTVTACAACDGACEETEGVPGAAAHVEGAVDYAETPPLGGDHNACWATWGVHEDEVPPENWVHNMEHGGVVVLVDCPGDTCSAEWDQLADWVGGLPEGRAILTRTDTADFPFTVVSWGYRLELGCLDLALIQAFFDAHVGQGPEDVTAAPGAGCM